MPTLCSSCSPSPNLLLTLLSTPALLLSHDESSLIKGPANLIFPWPPLALCPWYNGTTSCAPALLMGLQTVQLSHSLGRASGQFTPALSICPLPPSESSLPPYIQSRLQFGVPPSTPAPQFPLWEVAEAKGTVWVHVPFSLSDLSHIGLHLGSFHRDSTKYIQKFQYLSQSYHLTWDELKLLLPSIFLP